MRILYILILLFIGFTKRSDTKKLTIFYISNQGILIKQNKTSILIDGLFNDDYPDYPSPTNELKNQMINSQRSFSGLDYHLITHNHRDHFNPELLGQQMDENDKVVVIAPKQAKSEMNPRFRRRVISLDIGDSTMHLATRSGGDRITVFQLEHINPRFKEIQNYAYLIKIGGKVILHIGDASLTRKNLSRLPDEKVDVIILPYFSLNSDQILDALKTKFRDPKLIPVHMQIAHREKITQSIRAGISNYHVFEKSMDSFLLN